MSQTSKLRMVRNLIRKTPSYCQCDQLASINYQLVNLNSAKSSKIDLSRLGRDELIENTIPAGRDQIEENQVKVGRHWEEREGIVFNISLSHIIWSQAVPLIKRELVKRGSTWLTRCSLLSQTKDKGRESNPGATVWRANTKPLYCGGN